MFRPELILREARKGHGFPGGRKPLERRYQAGRFGREAQERREWRETVIRSLGRRKALKREAQER